MSIINPRMDRAHNLGGQGGGVWKLLSVLFYSSVHSSVNSFTDGLELLSACCDLYSSLVLCSLYTNASWTTVYTASTNSWVSSMGIYLISTVLWRSKRPSISLAVAANANQNMSINQRQEKRIVNACLIKHQTSISGKMSHCTKPSQAKPRWEHSHQALDSYTHQTN
jgi:hypothetical protein